MLPITIEFNDKQVKDYLEKLSKKLTDMTPVMSAISETMYKGVFENFEDAGKRLPKPWTDLSEKTKKNRERKKRRKKDKAGEFLKYKTSSKTKGYKKGDYRTDNIKPTWPPGKETGNILLASRELRDSITNDWNSTSAWVGTNNKYARTHQLGDDSRNIPARPFLELNNEDRDEILRDVSKYLEG
jgi:phage gpG-like protein